MVVMVFQKRLGSNLITGFIVLLKYVYRSFNRDQFLMTDFTVLL